MDWTGCDVVEVVPGKVFGAPILKHSRVTADAVWESYELGESVEEIAYSFSLNPEDIRKVLRLRRLTREYLFVQVELRYVAFIKQ